MSSIKVIFSCRDNEPLGTVEFGNEMALFIEMEKINAFCIACRESFHIFGDPLNYKIEYIDEDE